MIFLLKIIAVCSTMQIHFPVTNSNVYFPQFVLGPMGTPYHVSLIDQLSELIYVSLLFPI